MNYALNLSSLVTQFFFEFQVPLPINDMGIPMCGALNDQICWASRESYTTQEPGLQMDPFKRTALKV